MDLDNDFQMILDYAHFWNWLPDWNIVKDIYRVFPKSYSILTPFAYSYLEELIRSTTSEYAIGLHDKHGNPRRIKVGYALIELAINENQNNMDLVELLKQSKQYFKSSDFSEGGENRNNVNHGYMPPKYWEKESFENLIHFIATFSKFAGF